MNILKIIQRISEILFWIFFVIVVYQLTLKISGHSPTEMQIIPAILFFTTSYVISFSVKTAKFQGRVEEFMEAAKISFKKISEDMNEVKSRLNNLQLDAAALKSKIKIR